MAPLRIGIILPDVSGHCNPGTTLGHALKERGHHVTLISLPKAEKYAERAGLEFVPFGITQKEQDDMSSGLEAIAQAHGLQALKLTLKVILEVDRILLRELPVVLQDYKFDYRYLIIDEVSLCCGSVAEVHKIKFGAISNTLPFIPDQLAPPCFTSWKPWFSWAGIVRNTLAWFVMGRLVRPLQDLRDDYRKQHGLSKLDSDYNEKVPAFWLAQLPRCVDFPYTELPENFVHTTPWHTPNRDKKDCPPFPWDKLDGRPIVYVSLGTIQNRVEALYRKLAEACKELDVQLVMALGRQGATIDTIGFPEGAIVVDYAPQLQVLEKTTALVTHAGLNTSLEGLSYGLPMLALPITNDQPGAAARLAYAGAAVVIQPDKATPAVLRKALRRILIDPSYRQASERMQQQIKNGVSLDQVAELVEIGFTREESKTAFRRDPDVVGIVGEPPAAAMVSSESGYTSIKSVLLSSAVVAFAAWMIVTQAGGAQ